MEFTTLVHEWAHLCAGSRYVSSDQDPPIGWALLRLVRDITVARHGSSAPRGGTITMLNLRGALSGSMSACTPDGNLTRIRARCDLHRGQPRAARGGLHQRLAAGSPRAIRDRATVAFVVGEGAKALDMRDPAGPRRPAHLEGQQRPRGVSAEPLAVERGDSTSG